MLTIKDKKTDLTKLKVDCPFCKAEWIPRKREILRCPRCSRRL